MNFFDAKLVKENGKYAVVLGGYTVELAEDKQANLTANGVEPQKITLGVRPEHISLENSGIESKIEVSEMMGSSVHLHVNVDGKDVIVVVSTVNMTPAETAALNAVSIVNLAFNGNNCHVFSKETELSLEA